MFDSDITPYHYTECGLDNVFIYGMKPVIDEQGDETIAIANINGLHLAISCDIISNKGLLSGKEIRFLRTEMGMTQAELAKILHKDSQTVGRWERGEIEIDPTADTLVRLYVGQKLKIAVNKDVETVSGNSVSVATRDQIRIDGHDPHKYAPLPNKAA